MGAITVACGKVLTSTLLQETQPCVCIRKSLSSDISASLLAKAESIAADGAEALIVCADYTASYTYTSRISAYPHLTVSNIMTIDDLCLDILRSLDAEALLGRGTRVLDANEMDVLLEDMKVTGMKPRRLKEMLKFFYRSIAEFENEHEGWLMFAEEEAVFETLMRNLHARKAVMPCELPGLAYRAMKLDPSGYRDRTLFVDDFGALDKASQRLVEHLANGTLVVAGVEEPVKGALREYPHAEGFMRFVEEHEDAAVIDLVDNRAEKSRLIHHLATPGAEFTDIASEIAASMRGGVPADEILVAVPNTVWARQIEQTLAAQGIPTCALAGAPKVKGDPRKQEGCRGLKAYTLLKLLQEPRDATAMRSWLGFGDWLLRSDAFAEMLSCIEENGSDMLALVREIEAASDASDFPFPLAHKLLDPVRAWGTACESCAGKHGAELLNALKAVGAEPDAAMVEAFCDLGETADPASVLARLRVPSGRAPGCVTVAQYTFCHGIHVREVIVTGMVNGYLPSIDAFSDARTIESRAKSLDRDRVLFEDVQSCGIEKTVYSYFDTDRLENAESLYMQVERISMRDGIRYAQIEPSLFITDLMGR